MSENVVELASATVQPKPPMDVEFGVGNVLPGTSWEDWLGTGRKGSNMVSNPVQTDIDKAVQMIREDGQARALFRLLSLPIRSALKEAEWVAPEEGGGEKETEFANKVWTLPPQAGGMTTPLSRVVKQTLLGVVTGFSCFEQVFHVPESGDLKGKIVLRKLAYRDPRTIKFKVDSTGGFDGVRQIASIGPKTVDVLIPANKCWYWAANEEENPYYGIPFFSAAMPHYEIKKKLYYIAHLAAQFAAVPGRIGKTPPNPDPKTLAQFRDALAKFAFNTAMTHPDGYEVTPFNGTTGFDFIKLIDHHNHMMAKSVLAGFLDSEARASLVEINASANPDADMFILTLEAIMNEIAESWTTYVMPQLIDWNFNSGKYPSFKFGVLSDSTKDMIKEVFNVVAIAGTLNVTPEFVRQIEERMAKRLGLDVDYEEISKGEEEQAKAEEAAQQAQDEAMAQQEALNPYGAPGGPPGALPGPATRAGQQAARGFPGGSNGAIAASASIDDLVAAAQELLIYRPDDPGDEVV